MLGPFLPSCIYYSINLGAEEIDEAHEAEIREMTHPPAYRRSRRELLRQMAGASMGLPLAHLRGLSALAEAPTDRPTDKKAGDASPAAFSPEDEQFLDDLERSNFLFFWEQASPQTGLIKDRCNVRAPDTSVVASVASTGFGLTAICIAEKRGFVSHEDARVRVLATLTFLWRALPTHRGFFYHFANINTGERIWDSEVSSVDTAILLCGILTCREYFKDRDIIQLAHAIFDRVDWTWLSEDTALLPQGWTPEFGFLPSKWDYYSELMMIYLLGMGSSTHPLHPSAWSAWKRTTFEYDGRSTSARLLRCLSTSTRRHGSTFATNGTSMPIIFINSTIATDVHRRFCLELGKTFPDYTNDLWGITASDSDKGYVIWGGPPAMGPIDGSVVPAAAGGSLALFAGRHLAGTEEHP